MAKICSVDGCNNKYHAKGFCKIHYNKLRLYGDPLYTTSSELKSKRISQKLKGKPKSESHKNNLSKARVGRTPWNKGIPRSKESNQKQSEKMKGRPSPRKGMKQLESAKQILREKATGRPSPRKGVPHTKEANEKNRIAHLGKKATKESKKKMSISQNKPETLQKNRERRAKQVFPKKDSAAEKFMQELCKNTGIQFITHKNFNLKFQWHQVDIFIEPNICVEIDGDYPHANPNPYLIPSRTSTIQPGIKPDQIIYRRTASSIREKDRQITEALIRQGNHVIRFWQSELEQNPEQCIKKIMKLLNSSK